ncbi:MAG TPA: hypothetical protein VHX86_16210 [Tepidisphaeraceae bacterium]|jgi:hypothetical protein|nr:hypothetical protein [Tepidisphaeraceae bacterium]
MLNLIRDLKAKEAADRVKLIARYREILQLGDAATPAQIEELSALMAKLGYDATKAEEDARSVANRRFLQELSAEMAARQGVHIKVSKSHAALTEDMKRIIRELTEKHEQSGREKDEAERRFHESRRAAERLAAMERENFELFGLPEPEPDLPPHLSAPINLAKVTQQMAEDAEWANGSAKDRRKD